MSYSKITEAFKKVLTKSPTVNGRFYVLPKYGAELNTNDLEQAISTANIPNLQDGPLVAMMPPVAFGKYRSGDTTWTRYVCVLYFLRTSHVDEKGMPRNPSPSGASRVKVSSDWDEMKRIAGDTLRVMDQWFREGLNGDIPIVGTIRFASKAQDNISPLSLQGNDRRSGVKVITQLEVNEGCSITEYTANTINQLLNEQL